MKKSRRAFTFVEVLLASVAASIVIVGACEFYLLTIRQWNVQTSYGGAVEAVDTALERIEADSRYAMSFSTVTSGSNTLYVFTVPANCTSGTTTPSQIASLDATGSYVPQRIGGSLQYIAGPQVAFYLSNTTGSTSVSGGTILWRATAPAGSSTFTPDTAWSMASSSAGRCSLSSFSITNSGMPSNAVLVSLSAVGTSGPASKTYSISRELYMTSIITNSKIGAVTNLTAVGATSSVALSWTAPSGATSYNVYRGTTAGGESSTPYASAVTGTSYTDSSVTSGTTYYYYVMATGSNDASNEASATASSTGNVTISPTVQSLSNYYGCEQISLTNTQPMTSLTVTVTIVKTTGLTYNSCWNNFWGGYINQTYVDNGSTIVYTATLNTGDSQTTGTYNIDDAFNLTGTSHSTTGDTYKVQVVAGGVSQTVTGHF